MNGRHNIVNVSCLAGIDVAITDYECVAVLAVRTLAYRAAKMLPRILHAVLPAITPRLTIRSQ
eukprot:scaffold217570_cov19-Prasinocladus_malaysianus.AAC.1